jgi:hypothetical protein
MKHVFKYLIAALFIVFVSCNGAQNRTRESTQDTQMSAPEQGAENKLGKDGTEQDNQIPVSPSNQTVSDSAVTPDVPKANTPIDWDKKIIKTADLKLEVENFETANAIAHKLVKEQGGYIASEEQFFTSYKLESILTIKIPNQQFDNVVNKIPQNSKAKIIERKITTEDVTAEFIDTKSRLEAKKQMRLKYLEFLKQAKNMEEVLQVQNEINNIQTEIESATGRINYLTNQTSYSTIHLTLYQPLNDYYSEENPSFFQRVGKALKSGAVWIVDLFIGIIYLWPLLIIIAMVVLLIKRYKSRKTTFNSK